MEKTEKVVYVNLGDKKEMDRYPEKILKMVKDNGWKIVNAPRPFPCTIEWQGEFRHGCFYGAGLEQTYRPDWKDLDCWDVVFVTNEWITRVALKEARDLGVDQDIGIDDVIKFAQSLGYPWYSGSQKGQVD